MTDNEHIKPLDLSRYEGHTPGPWSSKNYRVVGWLKETIKIVCDTATNNAGRTPEALANARLIADAPSLLAEVRRLREALRELQASSAAPEVGAYSDPVDGAAAYVRYDKAINHARRVLGEEGGEE